MVQNMILVFCSVAVVHRYQSKIWTARRCIVLVTVFNIGQTLMCYFVNSSKSPMKSFVFGTVTIVNYVVFVCYLILAYFTTVNIYKRASKAKEETGYMNVESNDMISLIFVYGVILFGLVLNLYAYSHGVPLLTDRTGTQLTFIAYCQVVLTIMMVVLPSRMVRFEVVNVKHALETKKSIARHVYQEMRTPLNIVVMGLELLSGTINSLSTMHFSLDQLHMDGDGYCNCNSHCISSSMNNTNPNPNTHTDLTSEVSHDVSKSRSHSNSQSVSQPIKNNGNIGGTGTGTGIGVVGIGYNGHPNNNIYTNNNIINTDPNNTNPNPDPNPTSITAISNRDPFKLFQYHQLAAKTEEAYEIMDNVMISCGHTVEILNDMLQFENLE